MYSQGAASGAHNINDLNEDVIVQDGHSILNPFNVVFLVKREP